MFRQGDIISYTENRNSSDSKGSVSFGIYLNMCRLKRKITLKKLCHGLCSVSYLAEIMHGKKRADSDSLHGMALSIKELDLIWSMENA